MMTPTAENVHSFWFAEHGPDDWFSAKPAFDAAVAARFGETHAAAARCELWSWRETPRGRLAEIMALDQFSRQIHRGQAAAFATDTLALALAQEAAAGGALDSLDANERQFLLMPFMHAESLAVQEESVRLFATHCPEGTANFARAHRETIARFGRFPMRNAALGRDSTAAEREYMAAQAGRMF